MSAPKGTPPHLVITGDNHGPNLWITTLLGFAICVVALIARAVIKVRFELKKTYDDLILALGFVSL
jgi:hypothetical protein